MCSNGLTGIEDTKTGVCCVAACGQCGGEGCNRIPDGTAFDCCTGNILDSGVYYDDAGEAPCVMDISPSDLPTSPPNSWSYQFPYHQPGVCYV